jgi:pilus assembly protein Flp/PilA
MIEKLTMMALMLTSGRREDRGDRGATATEYALLVGLIAVAIVATVGLFGDALDGFFDSIVTEVDSWTTADADA